MTPIHRDTLYKNLPIAKADRNIIGYAVRIYYVVVEDVLGSLYLGLHDVAVT